MSEALLGKPTPKTIALLELCKRKKFVLASGPRFSTKSVSCLLALCDHCYRTRKANAIVVTVSQSAGMDSGIWADLIDIVIPAFGLAIKKKPYVQSVSKKPAVEVWNQYGEGVKIQLESLKDEDDVEKRFKGKRYSMMYVPELSNFKRRKTFDVWGECLRMVHLPDEQHLFLADTNPADEGDKSWIYHIWYMLRTADEFDPRLRALRDQLGLIEYDLSDNIYSSKERIEEVKARYAHDPDLYDRYVLGKWVTASEDGLFNKVFRPKVHIVGETESPTNKVPMLMIPQPGCVELGGGWDMGIRNSAFQIIEKYSVIENFTQTLEGGEQVKAERPISIFKVLDELVIVGEDFELRDFVEAAMKKMEFWENYIGHPVQWTHWSDRSAFEMKNNGELQHKEVYLISGGKIILQAAERSREMVKQRIDLYRKLLFQDRCFISAICEKTIEMTKSLKKGRGQFSIIQKESPHKHPFDSLTYYLLSECREEINLAIRKGFQPSQEEAGVIAIGL